MGEVFRAHDSVLGRDVAIKVVAGKLSDDPRDLSPSPDVVETLVSAVREGLPRGMLGRLVGRKGHDLPALSALLEEVQKRFAGQEPGRAAGRALEGHPAPASPTAIAGHSGELDPYGLPALLHWLATSPPTT